MINEGKIWMGQWLHKYMNNLTTLIIVLLFGQS